MQKLCYTNALLATQLAVQIDKIALIIPGNCFAYNSNARKVMLGSLFTLLEQKQKAKQILTSTAKELKAKNVQSSMKDLSNCLMFLSELSQAEGNYKEARSYAEQSLATLKKYASDKISEGAMLTDLCATYMKQGLLEESIKIGRDAVACFDMTDDGQNQLQAIAYNNLSLAYSDIGDYVEALNCSRRALKLKLAASNNKPNLSVAIAHVNVSNHLLLLERFEDALIEAKVAVQILDTQGFGESLIRATALQNLGHSYLGMGNLVEAKTNLLKGAAGKVKFMVQKDPEWAQLNLDLGRLYAALGEKNNADSYFGKAVSSGEKLLGTKHPKLAYIYRQYAKYLDNTHRSSQAEILRSKAKEIEDGRAKLKAALE